MRGLTLFYTILLFFLCGVYVVLKKYGTSIRELKKESNLRLENYSDRKKALEEDARREEGSISVLRDKEMMMVGLYEITKRCHQALTFSEIFGAPSV